MMTGFFELLITFGMACVVFFAATVAAGVLVALIIRMTDWLETRRDVRRLEEAQRRFAHEQRDIG